MNSVQLYRQSFPVVFHNSFSPLHHYEISVSISQVKRFIALRLFVRSQKALLRAFTHKPNTTLDTMFLVHLRHNVYMVSIVCIKKNIVILSGNSGFPELTVGFRRLEAERRTALHSPLSQCNASEKLPIASNLH